MDTIAFLYKKLGNLNERFSWLQQSYAINPAPTNLDIYNMSDAAKNVGKFELADSMARMYIRKYPDQEYGYLLLINSAKAKDSTRGTSFPVIQEYINFLNNQDAAKNAAKVKYQYIYIASIAADKMKDYRTALDAVNKILAIDPADQFATQAKPVLEKAVNAKPSGGSSGGGAKKTPASKKGK
jgi:tetratricopeptide (TPR) repeat protein